MRTTLGRFVIGLAAVLGIQSHSVGQDRGLLEPVFRAMEQSKSQAVECELRDGQLSVFESLQRIEKDGFYLERLDLRPMPQREMASKMGLDSKEVVGPLEGVTVGMILEASMRRGLMSWAVFEAKLPERPHNLHLLWFRRKEPLVVRTGDQTLTLSPNLFDYVSVSPLSRFDAPQHSRLAVVIHEPHSSRGGQFDMIEALEELTAANQDQQFVFLVEGDFERPDRTIPLEPWKAVFSSSSDKEALIAWSVHNYLIEGALAFRLLRQRDDIPAFAIDDSTLLALSPRQPDTKDFSKRIDRLPIAEEQKLVLKSLVLLPATRATPKQYETVEAALDQLIDRSVEHRDLFRDLRDLLASYRIALKRDRKMAEQIVQRLRQFPEAIPVVFTGNFHTNKILQSVAKDAPETAFLVLDVPATFHASEGLTGFSDSLHDPAGYLSKLRSRKLAVTPRLVDRPKIEELLLKRRGTLDALRRQIAQKSQLGKPATDNLAATLAGSPVLQNSSIDYDAKSDPKHPAAFAVVTPSQSGEPSKIEFCGPEKGEKESSLRHRVIALAMRANPQFESIEMRKRVEIEGEWLYWIKDRATRKVYFFQESKAGPMLKQSEVRKKDEKNATLRIGQQATDTRRHDIQRLVV